MYSADIIIIGGGPAGAGAAVTAARSGEKVLLLERERLPREKLCSGVLSPKSQVQLRALLGGEDASWPFLLGGADHSWLGRGMSGGMVRHAPLYFASRPAMDMALLERAASLGADVRDGQKVRSLDPETGAVTLNSGEILTARVVVGADGARGVSSRTLNGDLPRHAIGLEARIPDERDIVAPAAIVDFSMPGGYFWQFPKWDGQVAIGAGTTDPVLWPHLREMLARYAAHQPLTLPERVPGHPIPCFGVETVQRGRVLLAGDAAGLVDPLIMEGIPYAFLSGRLAAEAALRHLNAGISLGCYAQDLARDLISWQEPYRRLSRLRPLIERSHLNETLRLPFLRHALWRYVVERTDAMSDEEGAAS